MHVHSSPFCSYEKQANNFQKSLFKTEKNKYTQKQIVFRQEEKKVGLEKSSKIKLHQKFPKGPRNLITDVAGVTVGQVTLNDDEKEIHTGVTAIRGHKGNLFQEKLAAGAAVINGFGKSAGLVQIEELGTLETPIIMTNTLSVGTALSALTKYMLKENPDIGVTTGTVNCVVTECNDGELNDIRGMHVTEADVWQALDHCSETFEEGAVGSGTGMCCMGLKGGIGSASRIVTVDGEEHTIGVILMSNFGMRGNLTIDGFRPKGMEFPPQECEKGSVILVLATDLPLSDRQLRRMARRSVVGLCRTGSFLGNGSGDIAIAFSTANRIPHYSEKKIFEMKAFRDDAMDLVFEATAEAAEEAVLSSLDHAATMKGARGNVIYGLREYL